MRQRVMVYIWWKWRWIFWICEESGHGNGFCWGYFLRRKEDRQAGLYPQAISQVTTGIIFRFPFTFGRCGPLCVLESGKLPVATGQRKGNQGNCGSGFRETVSSAWA